MFSGRRGVTDGRLSTALPRLSRRGFFTIAAGTGVTIIPAFTSRSIPLSGAIKDFSARTRESALDPHWLLSVSRGSKSIGLSALDLERFPKYEIALPISGGGEEVEINRWTGVRLSDLVSAVGGSTSERLRITSLDQKVYQLYLADRGYEGKKTMVALELAGRRLGFEHGYPAALIAPGRPAALHTKWLSSIEVLS